MFKPTEGNDSLYEVSNDNGVRVMKFVTYKIWLYGVQCSHITTLQHSYIHLDF